MKLFLQARLALGFVALTALAHADPVTVRFACPMPKSEDNGLMARIVREFEAAHPGIRIKMEPVVADSYKNKLLSEYAAGVAPDCAVLNANDLTAYATRGAVLPLDRFADLGSNLRGRYDNALRAYTIRGVHYALPFDIACSAYIYYNKKAFDEAGLPYPDGSWTWDTKVRPELREKDFFWVVQRLTKGKTQYGLAPSWPQLYMETLVASSGVRMWDDDEDPKRLSFTDPRVVEVFQFAADSVNKYHWIPSNNDVAFGSGSTMQDEFRKGHVAMLESGAWDIHDMRQKHRGDWDIAPFPRFARGGGEAELPGEGGGVGILASSVHVKEAWEWVKWYCGPHGLVPTAQAGSTQPSIRSLALTPGVWLPAKDATGPARKPEHMAITDAMASRVRVRHLPDWFWGITNELQGTFYGVLSGETPAKIALDNLQSRLPAKLALARRRVNAPPYPFGPALAVGIAVVLGLAAWIYAPEARKRRRTLAERQENRSAYRFLVPWFFGLALTVGPMIYSLLLSFADSDIIQPPKWRGLGNYADLLNPAVDDTLFVSLRQTFLFALVSVPLGTVVAIGLAMLLNQKVRGIPIFRALFYLPSLASAVAMALIWARLFDKDAGLINALLFSADGKSGFLGIGPFLARLVGTPGEPINWLGNTKTAIPAFVIMGLWGAGGGTIIYLAGLQGISPMYHEAATLDGAGAFRRFRNVTLPLLTPTIFFSLLTGVIGALQVFSQAFVLTGGGPDRATLFTTVWLYNTAFGELRMGYASAIAWILFLVILAVTVLQLGAAKRWVHYEGDLK